MNSPRKHHFCPRFYLAGFTDSGKADGSLFAIDRSSGGVRRSNPASEGHQRDFYRMDLKGDGDEQGLETEFSKIESNAHEAISFVEANSRLPGIESMEYLVSFIGLLAARTPVFRESSNLLLEKMIKKVSKVLIRSPRAKLIMENERKKNPQLRDVDDSSVESFVDSENYDIGRDQNSEIATMLQTASSITDSLLARNWALLVANGGEHLVTSDHPVSLHWVDPTRTDSAGFALKETEVTVPLSKRFALVGTYENLPFQINAANRKAVAILNFNTLRRGKRFIWSPKEDFIWQYGLEILDRKELPRLS